MTQSPATQQFTQIVPGEVLLSVKNLSKSYSKGAQRTEIIGDLTFDVYGAEIVSIVGPSGVGKTTLLKCLAGLHDSTTGTIEISGRKISGPPREMALVFQDYSRSLMPWLTVEKNIQLPLRHLRLPKEKLQRRISQSLEAVGLAHAAKQYPWELSGGMQQRVAIARALAYRPEILIMDEPFASVDAQTRFELEDLVLQIRERFGITVLLVTHDIDEAVYLSNRIVAIGRRPAEVLNIIEVDLPHPRTQLETRGLDEFTTARHAVLELIQDSANAARPQQTEDSAND